MNDTGSSRPVFLERRNYRRRRMMDAARLMPILGVLGFSIPLLWPTPDTSVAGATAPVAMSEAMLFVFGFWVFLIVLAAGFGRGARRWSAGEQERTGSR